MTGFDVLATIGLGFLVLVAGTIVREDTKTAIPRITKALLRCASSQINERDAKRYLEEWYAHSEDIPELSGKIVHSLSIYLFGARRIARTVGRSANSQNTALFAQRAFDLASSMSIVFFFSSLLLAVFVLVALSGGPAIYFGKFLGPGRRPIYVPKFRTIDGVGGDGSVRFARHGRFLRATRLDELPMIFSVLKGDMALVGPKPVQLGFEPRTSRRELQVRPGVTGHWLFDEPQSPSQQKPKEVLGNLSLIQYIGVLLRAASSIFWRSDP